MAHAPGCSPGDDTRIPTPAPAGFEWRTLAEVIVGDVDQFDRRVVDVVRVGNGVRIACAASDTQRATLPVAELPALPSTSLALYRLRSRYCEGCEAEGRVLTTMGYCPECALRACGDGDGDRVGLPVPADVDLAVSLLDQHIEGCTVPVDNCAVCVLLDAECTECGTRSDDMTQAAAPLHRFVAGRDDEDDESGGADAVVVGCEGYVTGAARAAGIAFTLEARPMPHPALPYTCRSCSRPITVSRILGGFDAPVRWSSPWVHLHPEDKTGEHQAKPTEIAPPAEG